MYKYIRTHVTKLLKHYLQLPNVTINFHDYFSFNYVNIRKRLVQEKHTDHFYHIIVNLCVPLYV